MILDEIIAYKKTEVAQAKQTVSLAALQQEWESNPAPVRNFRTAIQRCPSDPIKLIAEVKKASPSQGIIRPDFNPVGIAGTYYQHHANALSVLTDRKFFQGELAYIQPIKSSVPLPILRKDFIIDEYQLWEAAVHGADCVLLIAAALDAADLKSFYDVATQKLGLSVLTEVHTIEEAKMVLGLGVNIIGINNRNLQTFQVSLATTLDILPIIPKDLVIVSESGIKTHQDVQLMSSSGVHALLIGETFMRSADIGAKMHELFPQS